MCYGSGLRASGLEWMTCPLSGMLPGRLGSPRTLRLIDVSLSLWSFRASCPPYGCSVWSLHVGPANYSLGCLPCKQSSPGTQLHQFPVAAVTSQGVWVGVTIWPTAPKMFTVWPFETKCWPMVWAVTRAELSRCPPWQLRVSKYKSGSCQAFSGLRSGRDVESLWLHSVVCSEAVRPPRFLVPGNNIAHALGTVFGCWLPQLYPTCVVYCLYSCNLREDSHWLCFGSLAHPLTSHWARV